MDELGKPGRLIDTCTICGQPVYWTSMYGSTHKICAELEEEKKKLDKQKNP